MLMLIPVLFFAVTDSAALVTAISASIVAITTAITTLIVLFRKLTRAEVAAAETTATVAEIKINVDGNLAAISARADKMVDTMAEMAHKGLEYATSDPITLPLPPPSPE